jgi:DNA polymerase (family X)
MTNLEIAELLRKMAAAYEILGENRFRTIAYDRAADSIEHSTREIKDLWSNGKLTEIPGLGTSMIGYLQELFASGKVAHFEATFAKLPPSIFPLLKISGIGPKKAFKLVTALELNQSDGVIDKLLELAAKHKISVIPSFGEKSEADIVASIAAYRKGATKQNRMILSEADMIADEIISYLLKLPEIKRADKLGSLRRQVSTIGDIDIAAATTQPEKAINHFLTYPHLKLIEKGPSGASVVLHNGHQVDFRVQLEEKYGAMLQYFTGSKNHNIKLRTIALDQGLSLSEYGIKQIKTGKVTDYSTEESIYKALNLSYIVPELREDRGEIEAAKTGKLPQIINLTEIKGDLHIHTSYDLHSSHDLGQNPLVDYLIKAEQYHYEYIGLSDHNPSVTDQSESKIIGIMKLRQAYYEQQYYSYKLSNKNRVQIVIMCEVDIQPDGHLALPEKAFDFVDGVIVSIHSSFNMPRAQMTQRIITALTQYPKVRILGHPTGRLLGRREGIDIDWDKIFATCLIQNVALEINAHPQRLDISDSLVREAGKLGVKMCIDSDSHAVVGMDMMKYGVSVARRGWATKNDIVNTMDYNNFISWFLKGV